MANKYFTYAILMASALTLIGCATQSNTGPTPDPAENQQAQRTHETWRHEPDIYDDHNAYGNLHSPLQVEEKASLVRLEHELDALEPVITEAEGKALVDSRVRFNYQWLRADVNHIKAGIREYLDEPHNEPRQYPPLRGDYRH